MHSEPQPGEVWIVTDPAYGPETWERIHDPGVPVLITSIAPKYIGYAWCDELGEIQERDYPRRDWDWAEHAARLWPPVPSWRELGHEEAP